MNQSNIQEAKELFDYFQKQKLYIEEIAIEGDLDVFEKELKSFLSKYGTIIDIKILLNRKLTRKPKTLCLCDF